MALDNEIYDRLFAALNDGVKKVSRTDCKTDKRVYKLFRTKSYSLQEKFNHVTDKYEYVMVSFISINLSIFQITRNLKILINSHAGRKMTTLKKGMP